MCGHATVGALTYAGPVLWGLLVLTGGACREGESGQATMPVELRHWELNIPALTGMQWVRVAAEPWDDADIPGSVSYDGVGTYRTTFQVDDPMAVTWTGADGSGLRGLYIPCIDDADEVRLNGTSIGKTGRFADSTRAFRSAARMARVYPLSPSLLRSGPNIVEIAVFDGGGLGGFCYLQTPVIGSVNELAEKAQLRRILNDVPRVFSFSFSLLAAAYFLAKILLKYSGFRTGPVLRAVACGFFPHGPLERFYDLPLLRRVAKHGRFSGPLSETEIVARLFLGTFVCIAVAIFQSTELTFKSSLLDWESFWFTVPTLAFAAGLAFLLNLLYEDVSGRDVRAWRTWINVCTHPLFAWGAVLALSGLAWRPALLWGMFTSVVLTYLALAVTALFVATLHDLYVAAREVPDPEVRGNLTLERMTRTVAVAGMVAAILSWFAPRSLGVFPWSFLIAATALNIWVTVSLSFVDRHRMRFPLNVLSPSDFNERVESAYPGIGALAARDRERTLEFLWLIFNGWSRDAIKDHAETSKNLTWQTFNKAMSTCYRSLKIDLTGVSSHDRVDTVRSDLWGQFGAPSFPLEPPNEVFEGRWNDFHPVRPFSRPTA